MIDNICRPEGPSECEPCLTFWHCTRAWMFGCCVQGNRPSAESACMPRSSRRAAQWAVRSTPGIVECPPSGELAGFVGLTNLTRRFRLSSPCALGAGEQSIHHLYECATAPGQTSRAPAGGVQVCKCRVHMAAPGPQGSRLAG